MHCLCLLSCHWWWQMTELQAGLALSKSLISWQSRDQEMWQEPASVPSAAPGLNILAASGAHGHPVPCLSCCKHFYLPGHILLTISFIFWQRKQPLRPFWWGCSITCELSRGCLLWNTGTLLHCSLVLGWSACKMLRGYFAMFRHP